jgi:hypothetical protein
MSPWPVLATKLASDVLQLFQAESNPLQHSADRYLPEMTLGPAGGKPLRN